MIWHIFKKDWKLQWKLVAMLALIQFIGAALVVKLSPFGGNRSLENLLQLLIMITMAGIPFLIAAVVHNDALPGVRQDWLIRPIQRKDLLLAKFLFVLIGVHGPMLLADLFRGLANGFSVGSSLAAAASRGLFVFLAFSVPLFAFASLTKNIMEAIAAALVLFLSFAGSTLFLNQLSLESFLGATTGLQWIQEGAAILAALAGAAVILGLQYFRRRTLVSRGVAVAAFVLALAAANMLPWNTAFAIQQRMSPEPGAGSPVTISFDPSIGKVPWKMGRTGDRVWMHLPLRFDNLPPGSALISDSTEVRRRDESGAYRGMDSPGPISVRQDGGSQNEHLQVGMRGDFYERIQNQPEPLEIELSLTLFRSSGAYTMPAINGSTRFPELGRCMTTISDSQTSVLLGCVPVREEPSCFRMYLQYIPSGITNPPRFQCEGNYAPFYDRLFVMPAPTRSVPFRDFSGAVQYPVDGSQLGKSQIVIETYHAVDHFTRTVSIPAVRLSDWRTP